MKGTGKQPLSLHQRSRYSQVSQLVVVRSVPTQVRRGFSCAQLSQMGVTRRSLLWLEK